jgi:hypothetical protein
MPVREKHLYLRNPGVPGTHTVFAQQIADLFTTVKQRHKAFSVDRERRFQEQLQQLGANPGPAQTHPVLFAFEQEYLRAGSNPRTFLNSLSLRFRGQLRVERVSPSEVRIHGTVLGVEALLGTFYFGGRRFEPIPAQPHGVLHRVYQRRGMPDRHYVLLDSGSFARRFVTRGLNYTDAWNLNHAFPLQAVHQDTRADAGEVGGQQHPLQAGAHMSVQQQVISHTRGWKKRFISTGISNHPAISTQGTAFHSIYGAVVIDLARVPRDQIFDIHHPDIAARVFGIPVEQLLDHGAQHGSPAGDYAGEKYLGLRDVLRTRELLVAGSIPFAAVYAPVRRQRLLAVAGNNANRRRALRDALTNDPAWAQSVEAHETIPRQWRGKRWSFLLMRDVGRALMAYNLLRLQMIHPSQEVHRLHYYVLQRPPAGMP